MLASVSETAYYFRVSEATIYRLIKRGVIPYRRIGGQYRISIEEAEQALKKRGV